MNVRLIMDSPVVKQIENTIGNALIILVIAPLGGISLSFLNGELHTWSDLPKALDHALFAGLMVTIGWIFMKSPLAQKFHELTASMKMPDGEQAILKLSNVSTPDPGTSTTTTMNPAAGTVTVKETTAPVPVDPPK